MLGDGLKQALNTLSAQIHRSTRLSTTVSGTHFVDCSYLTKISTKYLLLNAAKNNLEANLVSTKLESIY